jgi:hypothetical protein
LSKCVAFQAMVESSSCKRLSSCTSEWKPTGDALYWTVIVARVAPGNTMSDYLSRISSSLANLISPKARASRSQHQRS